MYTELMLLWFHLVFNLNTKHDIITNALTSIVGIFKTENGVCLHRLLRFCDMSPEILNNGVCSSPTTLQSMRQGSYKRIMISLIQVGYV